MECTKDTRDCPCTYPCAKHGLCCACVASHRRNGELPACYFSKEGEAFYDRSVEKFLQDRM